MSGINGRLPSQNIHNPSAIQSRFWSKVIQGESPDSCWDWSAAKDRHGYGVFCVNPTRRTERAHRYSWEITNGKIPESMNILHKCDNPSCANPEHLFLGTQADNMADMRAKGRGAKGDNTTARLYPEKLPRGDAHFSRRQPELIARGERHWNSKLSATDVRKMREMNKGGLNYSQIADVFGIHRRTASGICNGLQWRHV